MNICRSKDIINDRQIFILELLFYFFNDKIRKQLHLLHF